MNGRFRVSKKDIFRVLNKVNMNTLSSEDQDIFTKLKFAYEATASDSASCVILDLELAAKVGWWM